MAPMCYTIPLYAAIYLETPCNCWAAFVNKSRKLIYEPISIYATDSLFFALHFLKELKNKKKNLKKSNLSTIS